MKMKKWLVMLFICAAGVIACGKKIMPESGTNNQSKPVNDKSVKSETQSATTNTSATTTPSSNNMQSNTPTFRKPETSARDVEKTVYVTKCNSCHALKIPSDYTADQMKNILKVEIPKAKLSSKEAEQVTAYLLANSKR